MAINYNLLAKYIISDDIDKAIAFTRELTSHEEAEDIGKTSKEIVSVLKQLYINYFTENHIEKYINTIKDSIGEGPLYKTIASLYNDNITLTQKWQNNLTLIYRERLAREIREDIRARKSKSAVSKIFMLLNSAFSEEEKTNLANYVGSLLGTLDNDQEKVDDVIKLIDANMHHFHVHPDLINNIRQEKQNRLATIVRDRVLDREAQFSVNISSIAADIRKYLPGQYELREPNPQEIEVFTNMTAAIFNAFYIMGNQDLVYDISLILVELCPKEISLTASSTGVEGRLYPNLSNTAKKIVGTVFAEFGKNKTIITVYKKFINDNLKTDRKISNVIEVAGAFKSKEFEGNFKDIISDSKLEEYHQTAIFALSYLADSSVAHLLMNSLKDSLNKKIIESKDRRKAIFTLSSLRNILTSENLTPELHNKIVSHVLSVIPESETELMVKAIDNLFPINAEGVDNKQIKKCMQILVKGLLRTDTMPNFVNNLPGQTNPLSAFRVMIINVILRMGRFGLPYFIEEIKASPPKLSGAYIAYCEVLKRIGDVSCVSVLEQLINNAMIAPDGSDYLYSQERIYDSAENKSKPITKDYIVSNLIDTMKRIGGVAGETYLVQLYNQIKKNINMSPGSESIDILTRSQPNISPSGFVNPINNILLEQQRTKVERTPDFDIPLGKLIDSLKPALLFKNPSNQIRALRELGARKEPTAIQDIINCLGDKEILVQSAAIAALSEYMTIDLNPKVFERLTYNIIINLKNKDQNIRNNLLKFLKQVNVSREPLFSKLKFFASENENEQIGKDVKRTLGIEAVINSKPSVETPAENQPAKTLNLASETYNISMLEKKRLYLQTRQEWVKAGKVGPEPKLEDF